MALASIPKRKKIRLIIIIILSRTNDLLDQSISGSMEEVLGNQLMRANPLLLTNESGWNGDQNALWAVIEDISDAYDGESEPSQQDLEALSNDLETALGNVGL